jgi:CRP/FNR family transcriptional regulator
MDVQAASKKVKHFFAVGKIKTFDHKEIIIGQDDALQEAYYIDEGFVKAVSYTSSGTRRNHYFYGPNEVFSVFYIFNRPFSALSYEAASDVKCRMRSKQDFLNFIRNDPQVLFFLSDLMIEMFNRMYCLHLVSARERVLYTLSNMTKRFGQTDGSHMTLSVSMSRQELADFVNLRRETVGKILGELESAKVIIIGSKYTEIYVEKLHKLLKEMK